MPPKTISLIKILVQLFPQICIKESLILEASFMLVAKVAERPFRGTYTQSQSLCMDVESIEVRLVQHSVVCGKWTTLKKLYSSFLQDDKFQTQLYDSLSIT